MFNITPFLLSKHSFRDQDWRDDEYSDWRGYNNNNNNNNNSNNNNNLHRRLPQTPRLPSTLSVDGNPNLPGAAGSPAAFGVTVNGDRTADRSGGGNTSDHFAGAASKLGSSLAAAFQGYNGYAGGGGHHNSQQQHHQPPHQNGHQLNNGHSDLYHTAHPTYSSHPNLIGRPNGVVMNGGGGGHHRKLPPLPNKPSALKLGQWRQSSLPEEHNPPGHGRHVPPPLQPSDRPVFSPMRGRS